MPLLYKLKYTKGKTVKQHNKKGKFSLWYPTYCYSDNLVPSQKKRTSWYLELSSVRPLSTSIHFSVKCKGKIVISHSFFEKIIFPIKHLKKNIPLKLVHAIFPWFYCPKEVRKAQRLNVTMLVFLQLDTLCLCLVRRNFMSSWILDYIR